MKNEKIAIIKVMFAMKVLGLLGCVNALWRAAAYSNCKKETFIALCAEAVDGGIEVRDRLMDLEIPELMAFICECTIIADQCWAGDIPWLIRNIFRLENKDGLVIRRDIEGFIEKRFLVKEDLRIFLFKEIELLFNKL